MAASTQDFVPIKEIRDGVVVLKDGSLRAVLMTSSINLFLKSRDEQQGTMLQFQNFLNSLEFSTQILVQSRRLDLRPYLATLEERLKQQEEELLRLQTREYIDYIKWFSDQVNIMRKGFYIVIPYGYTPLADSQSGNPFTKLLDSFGKKSKDTPNQRFEESRSQLEQRIAIVQQGIGRLGMRAEVLGTEELIELYYNAFNPGENAPHMEADLAENGSL